MSDKYFYCYNKSVSDFLVSNGLKFITVAREPKSNKLFSLYEQSPKLKELLVQYKSNN